MDWHFPSVSFVAMKHSWTGMTYLGQVRGTNCQKSIIRVLISSALTTDDTMSWDIEQCTRERKKNMFFFKSWNIINNNNYLTVESFEHAVNLKAYHSNHFTRYNACKIEGRHILAWHIFLCNKKTFLLVAIIWFRSI